MYIIHAWYKHRMIPYAWILMKKRKTADYKKVFGKLKSEALELNINLNPKKVFGKLKSEAIMRDKSVSEKSVIHEFIN